MKAGCPQPGRSFESGYNENCSFRDANSKYPDVAREITDCLSSDVNTDLSRLWRAISGFAPLPDALPLGSHVGAA